MGEFRIGGLVAAAALSGGLSVAQRACDCDYREPMRAQMAARLVEEHGSPQAAADAVWTLARENGWYREGEGAERYLLTRPKADKVAVNKAALDFLVAWHGDTARAPHA